MQVTPRVIPPRPLANVGTNAGIFSSNHKGKNPYERCVFTFIPPFLKTQVGVTKPED